MVGCNGYECSIVLLHQKFSLHVAIHFLQHWIATFFSASVLTAAHSPRFSTRYNQSDIIILIILFPIETIACVAVKAYCCYIMLQSSCRQDSCGNG